jgi:CheY-like chemotaxis protein
MATVPRLPIPSEPAAPIVLVVEDDRANRVLLTQLLHRAG